jgi:HlyD family secretion protein
MIRDTSRQDRPLAPAATAPRWRRWTRRGLVALAALGAVAAVGHLARGWLAAGAAVDRSRLRIAEVARGTLVRDLVAEGRVVAANSPTLYAVAAGTVELKVRPGDAVRRDQVVATIASPELESRLVQEQATLASLEGAIGRAELDIEHGRANADRLVAQAAIERQAAARDLALNRQMFERGVIAELELRRSEDALEKAEIALRHARIEARLLGKELAFDLGSRRQAHDRQREVVRELERQVAALAIRSPVDGQVGQLLVAQRAAVASNAAIITVVELGAFELEARIPDSFARDLARGLSAELRAGAARYHGRVRSISPEVVDGHVAARLELVGARPAGLRQSQRLTARILIEERPGVLKVDRGPSLEVGGGHFAYFVVGDFAERRPIRTGAMSLDAAELLAGAAAGDRIVISGAEAFGDAPRVRLAD